MLRAKSVQFQTSNGLLKMQRVLHEAGRAVMRKSHQIVYFHRVDDPYCQLMAQILPEFSKRFDVEIIPRVVERLPATMYPDPMRYEAYSILDTSRLARLYGLGFPADAQVPDRLAVGMATRYLASKQDHPGFFTAAEELGAALWQEDIHYIRRVCAVADLGETTLTDNENLLRSLGHYASASLYYGGEFYIGLDRMDHLERRLNTLGMGDGEVHYDLTKLWHYQAERLEKTIAGKGVDLFVSVDSPYSYLALQQMLEFEQATQTSIRIKPVMPATLQGMTMPRLKRQYIRWDTAREARLHGFPFGKSIIPDEQGIKHAMALGFRFLEEGKGLQFFQYLTRAVWAKGIDVSTGEGMAYIVSEMGEPASRIKDTCPEEVWKARAEENRQDMLAAGCWGVPTFKTGDTALWGQDRLWAVLNAL